jgi:hypothetical protein
MTEDEKLYVEECVSEEGFSYCFEEYSDFKNINDPEFHRLRKKYLKVNFEFQNYFTNLHPMKSLKDM